jgi:2',3'-cyclic-nucleotide 2'-phosphodiesterase (5'-nucleotidase family)
MVIGLTHQTVDDDLQLLEVLGAAGPDVILGGHEHTRTERQASNGRWVLKADADGRSAALVRLSRNDAGEVTTLHEFLELDRNVPTDSAAQQRIEWWLNRHQQEYCSEKGAPAGCLDQVVGRTAVRLQAEETQIRRFETNLGNWVADRARNVFPDADIALINSGSLRLNQDIPPGPIRVRTLEELFAYPNRLVALQITGAVLEEALRHSVENWTGSGAFLQVSGLAFRFDPEASGADRVRDITLLETGRRILPDDQLTLVTWNFLHGGGDGYTMWSQLPVRQSELDMAEHTRELLEADDEPIAPRMEGRICNVTLPGPCLAVPPETP